MDLIAQIPLIGTLVTVVVPFLVVLGIVVFVHEYGHYIVGRWCGILAEVFSIGFGKELAHWIDRRGTRWRLGALPLGGYVKFLGDSDPASARPDSAAMQALPPEQRGRAFPGAAIWRRALTVAAGPVFNFLLSIVIFAGMALALGVASERPVIGEVIESAAYPTPLQPGDEIVSVDGTKVSDFSGVFDAFGAEARDSYDVVVRRDGHEMTLETPPLIPPLVGGLSPGGPADKAGLHEGDVIRAVNGQPIRTFGELQDAVRHGGEKLSLTVETEGATRELTLEPVMNPAPTDDGGVEMRPLIGVTAMALAGPEARTPGPIEALGHGVSRTWAVIDGSLAYISAMIGGEADTSSLGGPIRIASMSGDAAEAGIASFLGMIGLISASIGMINLFPIPVLDGGHLVFYAIEALRGRPLGDRFVEAATGLGLGLVILLMVFVTYNDLAGL